MLQIRGGVKLPGTRISFFGPLCRVWRIELPLGRTISRGPTANMGVA